MNRKTIVLAAAVIAACFIGLGTAQARMGGMGGNGGMGGGMGGGMNDHGRDHHHAMHFFRRHDMDRFRHRHRDSGYDSHYSAWCIPRYYGPANNHVFCQPPIYLY